MIQKLLLTLGAVLATASALAAKEVKKESASLVVTVRDSTGEAGWPSLEVERRTSGGRPVSIELERTRTVRDVVFVGTSHLLVLGTLGSGGDILTVVDAESGKVADTFWGYGATVSPDKRTVAYEFRIPPAIGQTRLSPGLLAYDLTSPPQTNRPQGEANVSETERGIVVYPETHRVAQRPFLLLDTAEDSREYVSPIAWHSNSKRFAVVEREATFSRLVVVDITRGLRQPSVVQVPIAREDFLEARFRGAIPDRYAKGFVTFKELKFSEDGQSVVLTSWRMGPYDERTLTLAVPSQER